ncbi:MAG: methyltransferase domain-containing protein [Methanomassiliicoccales archaeon]
MPFNPFFAENASHYAESRSHAAGKDLKALLSLICDEHFGTVLDVATGTGHTAYRMAEISRIVVAMDPTREMLKLAHDDSSQSNIRFLLGIAEKLPFADACFDAITCRRAAHHFTNIDSFLKSSYAVLRCDGLLLIDDMLPPHGETETWNELERLRDGTHKFAMDEESWRMALVSAGFEPRSILMPSERIGFQEWLSPVKVESERGRACLSFLKNSSAHFKSEIQLGGDASFIRRWLVIAAVKRC